MVMQITAFKVILARRIIIRGCEDYTNKNLKNAVARIESHCTLRFGFKLIKSISYTTQSNLFLHFFITLKCFSRSWGIVPFMFLQYLVMVYVLVHDYVDVCMCNLHNPHHTGHILNHKQHTADLQQLVALFPST